MRNETSRNRFVDGGKTNSSSALKGKTVRKNSWRRRRRTSLRRSWKSRERRKSQSHFSRWLHDQLHAIRVRRIAPLKVRVGMKRGNRGVEIKKKKTVGHKQDRRNTCRLFRRKGIALTEKKKREVFI